MAKVWTLAEAFNALKEHDKASIMDFGNRFPLSTHALEQAREAEILLNALPDHITMRKLEAALKEGVKPAPETDEEAMTPEEAKEAKEKGKAAKEEKKEAPKKEAPKKPAKKAEPEPEEEEDAPGYSGMTAPELFKLCKQRGIKAEPKKKGDYYIKLLEEDDAKAEEAEAEDDSWDDDDEEEEAPKKGRASKAKKTEEDDEDDWDI